MADLKFSVTAKCENDTKTIVTARDFNLIVDEPENLGGTNDGPNPVEYVLAALSGCLNVVGHIVAKEMGFTIRNLEMTLEGTLNPARFIGQSMEERAGYKNIKVSMNVDTDADNDTLQKWIEIIESRCPVSDNITNSTPVEIALA